MVYDNTTQQYLSGDTFSNGATIKLQPSSANTLSRDEHLLALANNKNILHVGFVDHLPLVDEKIQQSNWLHQKLIDVSARCYGVDINKKGVDYLHNHYEFENLYATDITSDSIPQKLLDTTFDYMFIPDVIEHIGNPVAFLTSIRKRFHHNVDKIVLTTPHAFRWDNVINTFKSIEVINTDHRFWFTPFTLSKIITDAGYTIETLDYCQHGTVSRKKVFKRAFLKRFPLFKDTLIIEIRLNP